MSSFPKQGYLYIAFGDLRIADEARISLKSLRAVDPKAHVTFVYEGAMSPPHSFLALFDHTVEIPGKWRSNVSFKVAQMFVSTPYTETLFVDTDTYFADSCRPVFDVLEYYDMALSHATHDKNPAIADGIQLNACTPYNTGLFAFRKNERVERFFKLWAEIHESRYADQDRRGADQPPFIAALTKSDVRCHLLSNLWNARFVYEESYDGKVRMLHGRHPNLPLIADRVNVTEAPRVWSPRFESCLFPGMPQDHVIPAKKYTLRRALAALKRFDLT